MDNRGLSSRAVSRASGRAESTILQLTRGAVLPSPELVRDIAPVLQIPQADLLVIAGIAAPPTADSATAYRNPAEIGELVSIASSLSDEQLRRLIDFARNLKLEDRD